MSYSDIINLWPSPAELAADIGQKPATVTKWRTRNSIPAAHWMAVCKAAQRRGIEMTVERMAQIQHRQRAA